MCCDLLYKCRGCFWKLVLPLWIIDLLLTCYLIIEFYEADIFACCTTDLEPFADMCRYEDLGGADNVFVDEHGYCNRQDIGTGIECTITGECAQDGGIVTDMRDTLCSPDVLDDVATCNWFWITAVFMVKAVGLLFLIILDLVSCCKKSDPAEEEAQQTEACCKCRKWGKICCLTTIKLLLKLTFLIFGTVATFLALYYMQLTGHVTKSSCSCVPNNVESLCEEVSAECMMDNNNYYAVVYQNVNLGGPYWADVVSNVLSTIIWIIRIAVMRHAMKVTHLADV